MRKRAYRERARRLQSTVVHPAPVSVLHDAQDLHPSLAATLDRVLRNFTGLRIPKGEHLETLELRLVLTPAQITAGGTLPLGVPIFVTCPDCGGAGDDAGAPCQRCHHRGVIEAQHTVHIPIPSRVMPGSVLEVPLHLLGIHNLHLRVHFAVDA